jgi:lactate dehydrogenase-like 2-hydroxyacid dehydrogenase
MEVIQEYDALLSMFDFKVTKALIDKATRLKIVSNYAVGYDNVDSFFYVDRTNAVSIPEVYENG